MKLFIILAACFLSLSTRKCSNKESAIPACIQRKIDSIRSEPKWNPPAEVYSYSYKNRIVYYFSSNCCDHYNTVVDENCNYVCAPSGGYTGRGDQLCPDFNSEAKKLKLIWKDDR